MDMILVVDADFAMVDESWNSGCLLLYGFGETKKTWKKVHLVSTV